MKPKRQRIIREQESPFSIQLHKRLSFTPHTHHSRQLYKTNGGVVLRRGAASRVLPAARGARVERGAEADVASRCQATESRYYSDAHRKTFATKESRINSLADNARRCFKLRNKCASERRVCAATAARPGHFDVCVCPFCTPESGSQGRRGDLRFSDVEMGWQYVLCLGKRIYCKDCSEMHQYDFLCFSVLVQGSLTTKRNYTASNKKLYLQFPNCAV